MPSEKGQIGEAVAFFVQKNAHEARERVFSRGRGWACANFGHVPNQRGVCKECGALIKEVRNGKN
jgi:hypothetical protein